jgi:hypothetical protein
MDIHIRWIYRNRSDQVQLGQTNGEGGDEQVRRRANGRRGADHSEKGRDIMYMETERG